MAKKKMIMPPTYFMILLIISIALHFIFPIKRIIPFPYNHFGWILIAIGITLNIWADRIFKDIKTTIKPNEMPSKFVDYGPFKLSRHPVYLGMLMILLGVFAVAGTLITLLPAIAFVIIIEMLFIPLEERNMQKKFKKKYAEYKKKVRRWI